MMTIDSTVKAATDLFRGYGGPTPFRVRSAVAAAVAILGHAWCAGNAGAEEIHHERREIAPHATIVQTARGRLQKPAPKARHGRSSATTINAHEASEGATDVWLPEGYVLTPSRIDRIRWGAALELYGTSDAARRVSMSPELEAIRAHYGTYKQAMFALTGKVVP